MLRYVGSAMALKFFSATSHTKRAYRALGNVLGERKRKKKTHVGAYIERGKLFLELSEKYGITKDGDKMLEIGTGWLHFHSMFHRLFHNVEISMLDIWDCRQFGALGTVFEEIARKAPELFEGNERAKANLDTVLNSSGYDELYEKFGLAYFVDETGSLKHFESESFDCVFSFHVLEHVQYDYVDGIVEEFDRVLKPGGYSVHQIGIDDHLAHYDRSVSPKNYIRYSDKTWKMFFENDVQYFNRLQTSEWESAFRDRGFVPLESIAGHCDIDKLKVSDRFAGYSKDDLSCTTLTLVHRKPE